MKNQETQSSPIFQGFPPKLAVQISVPSGKLAVANDLRQFFPSLREETRGSPWDKISEEITRESAKEGLLQFYVGNSCPSVFLHSTGPTITVGGYLSTLWDEEGEKEYPNPIPNPFGEEAAQICTDLWWVCLCDLEDLCSRSKAYGFEGDPSSGVDIIDVPPGVYELLYFGRVEEHDVPFAQIRLVEGAPIVECHALEEDLGYNVGVLEILLESISRFPSLYLPSSEPPENQRALLDEIHNDPNITPERREELYEKAFPHVSWEDCSRLQQIEALRLVAQRIFSRGSTLEEWHPNGFPRARPGELARARAEGFGVLGGFPKPDEVTLSSWTQHKVLPAWYNVENLPKGYAPAYHWTFLNRDRAPGDIQVKDPSTAMRLDVARFLWNLYTAMFRFPVDLGLHGDPNALVTAAECANQLRSRFGELLFAATGDDRVVADTTFKGTGIGQNALQEILREATRRQAVYKATLAEGRAAIEAAVRRLRRTN